MFNTTKKVIIYIQKIHIQTQYMNDNKELVRTPKELCTLKEPFCKVSDCRYPYAHVTSRHRCAKCNKQGHGQIECNKLDKMMRLEEYKYDILPENLWCESRNCGDYWTHVSDGHVCETCNRFHTFEKCSKSSLNKMRENKINENALTLLDSDNKTIDNILPEELWCTSKNCNDYWSHITDDHICSLCNKQHVFEKCPKYPLKKIIENKKMIENNVAYEIKCPTCRVVSFCSDVQTEIFGLSEKCSICYENSINFILPICRHVYCKQCMYQIKSDVKEPINAEDVNLAKNLKTYGKHIFRFYDTLCYYPAKLTNGKIAFIEQINKDNEPNIRICNPEEKHTFISSLPV